MINSPSTRQINSPLPIQAKPKRQPTTAAPRYNISSGEYSPSPVLRKSMDEIGLKHKLRFDYLQYEGATNAVAAVFELMNSPDLGSFDTADAGTVKNALAKSICLTWMSGKVHPNQALPVSVKGKAIKVTATELYQAFDEVFGGKETQSFPEKVDQFFQLLINQQGASRRGFHSLDEVNTLIRNMLQRPLLGAALDKKFDQLRAYSFNTDDQTAAWKIIQALPASARGKLHGVPAEHISANLFLDTIRDCWKNNPKMLPKPLLDCLRSLLPKAISQQKAAEALNKNEPALIRKQREAREAIGQLSHSLDLVYLKSALYGNPQFIQTILELGGVLLPKKAEHFSAQELAQSVCHSPMAKLMSGLNFEKVYLEKVFDNLNAYPGFDTRSAVGCATSFADVICPSDTAVKSERHPGLRLHANYLTYPNVAPHGKSTVIAAMQPVVKQKPSDQLAHSEFQAIRAFFTLVQDLEKPLIIDLRNTNDFDKHDSFRYYPHAVGEPMPINSGGGKPDTYSIMASHMQSLELPNTTTLELELTHHGLTDDTKSPLTLVAHTNWVDQQGVEPEQLRSLSKIFRDSVEKGHSVIVHCKAGVGRTGTLITYSRLYYKLIQQQQGRTLLDAKGEPNLTALVRIVVDDIIDGRLARGGMWVQTPAQFALLVKTLKQDLRKLHTSPPAQPPIFREPSTYRIAKPKPSATIEEVQEFVQPTLSQASIQSEATPTPIHAAASQNSVFPKHSAVIVPHYLNPQQSVHLPANKVNIGHNRWVMCQEPQNENQKLQHWHSLFSKGTDVVEITADPKRFGMTCNLPGELGLNPFTTVELEKAKREGSAAVNTKIGEFHINAISCTSGSDAQGKTATITLHYTDTRTGEAKSIRYLQILTPFKERVLTAAQLNWACDAVEKAGLDSKNLWMTSVTGVGRPSALSMALMLRHYTKTAGTPPSQALIDNWIEQGRRDRGQHFVHSSQQKQQLLALLNPIAA